MRHARGALLATTLIATFAALPVLTVRSQLTGAAHLETGFIPDPAVLTGRAAGTQPVTKMVPPTQREACRGFVSTQPSHVLELDTRFGFMRIFATGPGDLVLAVRNGERWICSGDRFGPHPSVEGMFERGRLEVWVGTEAMGGRSDYTLRLTETRSIRPGVGGDDSPDESVALARDVGLQVDAATGAQGGTRLRRGFLPDPQELQGVAGGPLDGGGLGGTCRGRITEQPTHVVTLADDHDFLQLYLTEGADLSLIVLTPEGRFLCDVGTSEVVEVSGARWPAGDYRIWIGAPQEDATVRYRLAISEIRRVR